MVGSTATQLIGQFKVDYAIIGASAIDEEGALLDFDYREVQVAQAIRLGVAPVRVDEFGISLARPVVEKRVEGVDRGHLPASPHQPRFGALDRAQPGDGEQARITRALAANQGLYNGFLAAGLAYALVAASRIT